MKPAARRTLLALAFLVAPLSAARALAADDAPPPPPGPAAADAAKPVRDAFAAYQEAMKAVNAAGRDMEKRKPAVEAMTKARTEFLRLFAAADWNAFDVAKDSDLLVAGYSATGGTAWSIDGDLKLAGRVLDAFSKSFPTEAARLDYNRVDLLVATGDFAKAKEALAKDAATGDAKGKASAQVQLGDILSAEGDLAAAQKAWEAAVAVVPADADPKKDREILASKSGAEARLVLVGKPAPEIDSKTWIGGEAKPLSSLKGSVVVVDFWATWCVWCRKAMPHLSKLYDERKKDGLVVLGVTHVFPSGFMPKAGTKDPMRDGESMKVKPEEYSAHLEQFKTNLAISYPFVVATPDAPKAYRLAGWPTLAVLDREGKAAFYAVGTDPAGDALIEATVERLLKAPAPTTK